MRVNKIVNDPENRGKIKGQCYGPLLELFDVDSTYATAVEVAAGNRYIYFQLNCMQCIKCMSSLFHAVVDTDETAANILELMQKENGPGRVTFIPLNISYLFCSIPKYYLT